MPDNRFCYPGTRRLSGKRNFQTAFDAGVRESRGPLTVFARPNGLTHPRLGLSLPRRVGTAVRRNAIKRRLREAFRLMQHDVPAGYDLVVVMRAHEPLRLAEYQKLMSALIVGAHAGWTKARAAERIAARG